MKKYIMRLDDACEKMDVEKWKRIENLLDKYEIKPLVGIIPHCEDSDLKKYETDLDFWLKVERWCNKGWTLAMHGYNHVYSTSNGGINPINKRSEFAGESLMVQKNKIKLGIEIFREKGFSPMVFFAPSHTFDQNTIIALQQESNIRIISDTIANSSYKKGDFTFVPQQCGRVRWLPFKMTTFCYHPNTMKDDDFETLETFLKKNKQRFICFPLVQSTREFNLYDRFLNFIYMRRHK